LPGGVNNGAFSANGAHGQVILVNPAERVIVAIQSAWRLGHDSEASAETVALLRAAVRALRQDPAS
jgi:CubicO group peptidase (beta-lactamase class C family)